VQPVHHARCVSQVHDSHHHGHHLCHRLRHPPFHRLAIDPYCSSSISHASRLLTPQSSRRPREGKAKLSFHEPQ
jgi:hypothetical protein